jgi:putative membrane protein
LTLVNDLGWSTIPIVTVVAFTLMGIEGIADEIEMPFGKCSVRINIYVAENSIRK